MNELPATTGPILSIALAIGFLLVSSALLLSLWRLILGPDRPDRILALDTLYVNTVALLVLLGQAADLGVDGGVDLPGHRGRRVPVDDPDQDHQGGGADGECDEMRLVDAVERRSENRMHVVAPGDAEAVHVLELAETDDERCR